MRIILQNYRMKINTRKIKVPGVRQIRKACITLDDQLIEKFEDFSYFGSNIKQRTEDVTKKYGREYNRLNSWDEHILSSYLILYRISTFYTLIITKIITLTECFLQCAFREQIFAPSGISVE